MKRVIFGSVLVSFYIFASGSIADINLSKAQNPSLLIEKIEKLSISNHLKEALNLANNSLKSYPNSINLHLLYAKLLYWNQNEIKAKEEIDKYAKYNQDLYKKIYTAWAIKRLNTISSSKKRIQFFNKLHPFAQDSYDARWVAIDSYIKLKRFKEALLNAKLLSHKYPKSQEAQERFAQLLFWNGNYKKSLNIYKKLAKKYGKIYQKNINQLQTIINAKKTTNKKVENSATKQEPIEVDKKHKSKYMIGVGFENATFSDKRYKNNTKYIEATLPIKDYTLYVKIEDTKRYKLKVTKLSGEFYPKLPEPLWGYLSFSFTSNSDFFAHYSIGWHQYYVLDKWQFGASYEFNKYKKESISILTLEYAYYFNQYFFIREQLTYVPDNKSWAHLLQIKHQEPSHLEWYFNYTYSSSYKKKSNRYIHTKKNRVEIGGEYPINEHFIVGGNLSKSWFKSEHNSYTQTNTNLFIRYYW